MRRVLILAAGVAALAIGGSAVAQDQPRQPRGVFAFDANSDGAVTRAEFDAGHAARFTQRDANNDGQLTREERRAGFEGRRGRGGRGFHGMRGADANNDGDITRDEFLARPLAMFQRIDTNGDGVIQASERPQRPQRAEGQQRQRPQRANPDANNDGMISRAEHAAMGGAMFDRLDANDDGRVTQDEAHAMRGRRGPRQAQ